MSLQPGTRLGPYEITAAIGAGGMGEVYRARDTALNRDVAIKVLPESLAGDPDRLARFQREAEALAALNHPNIAHVYGLEKSGASPAIVMELVEGPTLADRIKTGAIPLDEALPIARQIAEALEAAHERGIIHRDLKPANVKVRDDGTVKVLDFGLAKAMAPDPASAAAEDLANSPTLTARATQMGVVLGTAAYMAPEQAKGKPVDKRADIWAFGAVLYEMLTGTRAFAADDVSETLAAVLRADVKWDALPRETPARVRQVAMTCLQRDQRQRARDIGDVRLALEGAFETSADRAKNKAGVAPWRWASIVLGMAVVILTSLWIGSLRGDLTQLQPLVRFDLADAVVPASSEGGNLHVTIAPDGSRIVYGARGQLWERPLTGMSELEPRAIPGTEGRVGAIVSPDGALLVSEKQGVLSVGDSKGGPLTDVAVGGRTPTFGAGEMLYYAGATPGTGGGQGTSAVIYRIAVSGGEPQEFARMEGAQLRYPDALPAGRGLLVTIAKSSDPAASRIGLVGPEGGGVHELFPGTMARYAESGHIVYTTAEGTLMAVAFDLGNLKPVGAAVAVLEGVSVTAMSASQFDISDTGTLVYVSESDTRLRPVWVDRAGNASEIDPQWRVTGPIPSVALSPEGRRLAYSSTREGITDIWVKELDHGPSLRITHGEGTQNFRPSWSSDGESLTFISNRSGGRDVWTTRADGSGIATPALGLDADIHEALFSADREWLVYRAEGIWTIRLEQEAVGIPVAAGEGAEWQPTLSPNGRWMAYRQSDETGRSEVYAVPFPSGVASARVPISNDGGTTPLWSADGKELFYINRQDELVVVTVAEEGLLSVASRQVLFSTKAFIGSGATRVYDVSPNGQRFLMLELESLGERPVTVILNFSDELRRRLPGR